MLIINKKRQYENMNKNMPDNKIVSRHTQKAHRCYLKQVTWFIPGSYFSFFIYSPFTSIPFKRRPHYQAHGVLFTMDVCYCNE